MPGSTDGFLGLITFVKKEDLRADQSSSLNRLTIELVNRFKLDD